ncbi:hypothetical protein [Acidimangrovimonas pyrenivorans]|uniref:EthD domain-containing protein n=1 Tax=Acidimangrovimonas pyrenivorans TaxID=2030798 RepID=A0ABV7AEJ9_9RHOB
MSKKIVVSYRAAPGLFDMAMVKAAMSTPDNTVVKEGGDEFAVTFYQSSFADFERFQASTSPMLMLPGLPDLIADSFDETMGTFFAHADQLVVHVIRDEDAVELDPELYYDDDESELMMMFHPNAC